MGLLLLLLGNVGPASDCLTVVKKFLSSGIPFTPDYKTVTEIMANKINPCEYFLNSWSMKPLTDKDLILSEMRVEDNIQKTPQRELINTVLLLDLLNNYL